VRRVVPVLGRQVLAHQLLDPLAVGRLGAVALELLAQLVGDHRGDEGHGGVFQFHEQFVDKALAFLEPGTTTP
jgi:hypothetical protein